MPFVLFLGLTYPNLEALQNSGLTGKALWRSLFIQCCFSGPWLLAVERSGFMVYGLGLRVGV